MSDDDDKKNPPPKRKAFVNIQYQYTEGQMTELCSDRDYPHTISLEQVPRDDGMIQSQLYARRGEDILYLITNAYEDGRRPGEIYVKVESFRDPEVSSVGTSGRLVFEKHIPDNAHTHGIIQAVNQATDALLLSQPITVEEARNLIEAEKQLIDFAHHGFTGKETKQLVALFGTITEEAHKKMLIREGKVDGVVQHSLRANVLTEFSREWSLEETNLGHMEIAEGIHADGRMGVTNITWRGREPKDGSASVVIDGDHLLIAGKDIVNQELARVMQSTMHEALLVQHLEPKEVEALRNAQELMLGYAKEGTFDPEKTQTLIKAFRDIERAVDARCK